SPSRLAEEASTACCPSTTITNGSVDRAMSTLAAGMTAAGLSPPSRRETADRAISTCGWFAGCRIACWARPATPITPRTTAATSVPSLVLLITRYYNGARAQLFQVAHAHVDELLGGRGPLGVDEADARPKQVQLSGQVARQRTTQPSAQHEHSMTHVRQLLDNFLDVMVGQQLQRCLQIATRDLERAA